MYNHAYPNQNFTTAYACGRNGSVNDHDDKKRGWNGCVIEKEREKKGSL